MAERVLEVTGVRVERRGRVVVEVDRLAIDRGELVAVVGPNGAGKSTLLHAIGTLLPCRAGALRLFGRDVRDASTLLGLRRRCGFVFQSPSLLRGTVFDNVAAGLVFRGVGREETRSRVRRSLRDLGCDDLALRRARSLSGGETQRVCLAQALAFDPELLLLDEPVSALDRATRGATLVSLRRMARERGMTAVLVSHDFDDVLSFADRAVALTGGRVAQDAAPQALMRRPASLPVARLVGMDNILPCTVERTGARATVHVAGLRYVAAGAVPEGATHACFPGDAVVPLRSEVLDPGVVPVTAVVRQLVQGVGSCLVVLDAEGTALSMRLGRADALDVVEGELVQVGLDTRAAHFI
jgi:tungstate transport system ATP-binding protein